MMVFEFCQIFKSFEIFNLLPYFQIIIVSCSTVSDDNDVDTTVAELRQLLTNIRDFLRVRGMTGILIDPESGASEEHGLVDFDSRTLRNFR